MKNANSKQFSRKQQIMRGANIRKLKHVMEHIFSITKVTAEKQDLHAGKNIQLVMIDNLILTKSILNRTYLNRKTIQMQNPSNTMSNVFDHLK